MTWRVFTDPGYIIGSGIRPGLIQRIFIKLDLVLESHNAMQNPVVEAGDFDWTFDIAPTDALNTYGVLGDTASGAADNFVAVVKTTSNIRFKVGGVDNDFDSIIATPSVLSSCRVTRVGTQMTVTIGVISETKTVSTAAVTIDRIGVLGTVLEFDGIIANVDLGNGNAWKLDRATGNTEQAANGSNLLTYVNIPESNRELFQLSNDGTQWENISPQPQNLPAIIEVA